MRRFKLALMAIIIGFTGSMFLAQPASAVWCAEIGDTGVCTCPPGQIWKIDTGIRC